MTTQELWIYIVNKGIATEAELMLVTDINGYNIDTLYKVIVSRTGYRNLEQLEDSEEW